MFQHRRLGVGLMTAGLLIGGCGRTPPPGSKDKPEIEPVGSSILLRPKDLNGNCFVDAEEFSATLGKFREQYSGEYNLIFGDNKYPLSSTRVLAVPVKITGQAGTNAISMQDQPAAEAQGD